MINIYRSLCTLKTRFRLINVSMFSEENRQLKVFGDNNKILIISTVCVVSGIIQPCENENPKLVKIVFSIKFKRKNEKFDFLVTEIGKSAVRVSTNGTLNFISRFTINCQHFVHMFSSLI